MPDKVKTTRVFDYVRCPYFTKMRFIKDEVGNAQGYEIIYTVPVEKLEQFKKDMGYAQ